MQQPSIDELLLTIQEAEKIVDRTDLTLQEWADTLGFGMKKTRKYMKKLVEKGLVEVQKVAIEDITGRRNYTYVYRNRTEDRLSSI